MSRRYLAALLRKPALCAQRWAHPLSKQNLLRAAHTLWPAFLTLSCVGVAHAQGTMDFSGATTLMSTFNAFAAAGQERIGRDINV
jgi:hypothetical protein